MIQLPAMGLINSLYHPTIQSSDDLIPLWGFAFLGGHKKKKKKKR
jgi:hypothetical protein